MRPLQLRVTAEPLELRAYPEPPGRRPPAPGCQVRRVTSVAGAPFGSLGCLIISAFASAMSHFILAESQAMNLALTVVLTLTFQTVERRARSARYPCLITAETEPPGRLHSSTGTPYQRRGEPRYASAHPDCSGAFSVSGAAPLGADMLPTWRRFQSRDSWTYV